MGINVATMSRGNVLELKLNEWYEAVPGSLEKRRADVADIKTLVDELNVDLTHQHALAAPERRAQLDIVLSDIQQLKDKQLGKWSPAAHCIIGTPRNQDCALRWGCKGGFPPLPWNRLNKIF